MLRALLRALFARRRGGYASLAEMRRTEAALSYLRMTALNPLR